MATKNPRVVGYVQPENHAKLKAYMQENNLSESKALDIILGEFFGVPVPRVTPGSTPIAPERIEALERQVAELGERLGKSRQVMEVMR